MIPLYLLHPVFVHFAVAFIVTAFFAELFWLVTAKDSARLFSKWNVVLGTGAALLSTVAGIVAENTVRYGIEAVEAVGRHELAGYVTLGLSAMLFLWRTSYDEEFYIRFPTLYFAFLTIVTVMLLVTAYFGGQLVFSHGVGVSG